MCHKVFNNFIDKEIFTLFIDSTLTHQISLDLKSRHSCINQYSSIIDEIYQSLYHGKEVRSVFMETSKTFDEV